MDVVVIFCCYSLGDRNPDVGLGHLCGDRVELQSAFHQADAGYGSDYADNYQAQTPA